MKILNFSALLSIALASLVGSACTSDDSNLGPTRDTASWDVASRRDAGGTGQRPVDSSMPHDGRHRDNLDARRDAESDSRNSDFATDSSSDTADGAEFELPPKPWNIFEQGPYRIGFRDFYDSYDAIAQPGREIRIVIWYPTTDQEGKSTRYYNIVFRKDVLKDAAVAPQQLPFPVLVFSHGNGSMAEQSYFLAEHFASHGWVVVAPDHTGNTLVDNPGGIRLETAIFRPQDVIRALDVLYGLPPNDPLHGRLTASAVMTGHSFGGFTSLVNGGATIDVEVVAQRCERGEISDGFCNAFEQDGAPEIYRSMLRDPRIKAIVPMTPGGIEVFRSEGLGEIDIPVMLMTAEMDDTLPNEDEGDPIWEAIDVDESIRLNFHRAGHFTFTNMCELLGFYEPVQNDGCSDVFIPYQDAFPAINGYMLAFSEYHLLGQTGHAALLDGSEQPYEQEIEISTK